VNQAFRLMELIGEVNDCYIEASCMKPRVKRKINFWPYMIAAVLALALIGGGTAFLRWNGSTIHNQSAGASAAESAAAAEPAEAPAEEAAEAPEPLPEPAAEEAVEGAAEETMEAAEDTAEEQKERDEGETDPVVAEYLENLTIGPLYLGMPEAEVLSVVGDPENKSNSGPITREDGITIVSWFYSGYSIQLADAGDGYVVNEIFVGSYGDLALSDGIGIGSTEEAVAALALPFAVEDSVAYVGDDTGEREVQIADYILTAGSRTLDISTADGVVECMRLGYFYPEPEFDWDAWNEAGEMPYDMSGDPITVYVRQEDGWQEVELTGKDAKRLEVILNIEELRPGDDLREPQYVIDFHSGTVAALCGDNEEGTVYTCPEGVAFSPDLLDKLDAELDLYMNCVFPEGVWETVRELTAS